LARAWLAVGWAASAAGAETPPAIPYTYTQVYELVARAEGGDCEARAEGLAAFKAEPDGPLAGAAYGRLLVVEGCAQAFVAMRYYDYWRGFRALNEYIGGHAGDPTPRVWRAASAVDTNYVFWSAAKAEADLEFALKAFTADADLPGDPARCKLLLGMLAKDQGDLKGALTWWREAFAADPAGPAGKEAARYLELFTG
jgi:hypothetical protein